MTNSTRSTFASASSLSVFAACVLAGALACSGCVASRPSMPGLGFAGLDLGVKDNRSSLQVVGPVEGKSSTLNILFGAIQVIDGDKVKVFWIPFFKDKHTPVDPPYSAFDGIWQAARYAVLGMTEERACASALESVPEADSILHKSSIIETAGLWPFAQWKRATVHGKAVRLRDDSETESKASTPAREEPPRAEAPERKKARAPRSTGEVQANSESPKKAPAKARVTS